MKQGGLSRKLKDVVWWGDSSSNRDLNIALTSDDMIPWHKKTFLWCSTSSYCNYQDYACLITSPRLFHIPALSTATINAILRIFTTAYIIVPVWVRRMETRKTTTGIKPLPLSPLKQNKTPAVTQFQMHPFLISLATFSKSRKWQQQAIHKPQFNKSDLYDDEWLKVDPPWICGGTVLYRHSAKKLWVIKMDGK